MVPGSTRAFDSITECFEAEYVPCPPDGSYSPVERWTAKPASEFLPDVEWTVEWVAERGADEMGTDGAAEAWDRAGRVPEVRAAFQEAQALLASHVRYRMCDERVGWHGVTVDGEALVVDGKRVSR